MGPEPGDNDMAVEKVKTVDDEDKMRKASLLLMAAKTLENTQIQDLTPEQLQTIREIHAASQKAIHETEHPSFRGVGIPNNVSCEQVLSDSKVQEIAAQRSITSKIEDSIFQPVKKKGHGTSEAFNTLLKKAKRVVSSEQRVSSVGASLENLEHALNDLSSKNQELAQLTQKINPSHKNYHVAKEILELGLKLEEGKTKELFGYKKQIDEYKQKTEQLLTLSKYLDALPADAETHDLKTAILDKLEGSEKEEMKKCIQEVFVTESSDSFNFAIVTKEQVAKAKMTNTDKMSLYRTHMTNIMTIDVADATHRIHQFLLVMQNTIRLFERLIGAIVQKYVNR